MLTPIADNIWFAQHPLAIAGIPLTTRMTIVRLSNGALWIHSPIPINTSLKAEIDELGPVQYVVAPNLFHHLFIKAFASTYPQAALFGAPGLAAKRPDIANLQTLQAGTNPWAPELDFLIFGGIPKINESVWFHAPSKTLILTDICQDYQGSMAWKIRLWAKLSGVRSCFDMPLLVRMCIRDKLAARASADAILRWPFTRVVVAHNSVLEQNAKEKVTHAFRRL